MQQGRRGGWAGFGSDRGIAPGRSSLCCRMREHPSSACRSGSGYTCSRQLVYCCTNAPAGEKPSSYSSGASWHSLQHTYYAGVRYSWDITELHDGGPARSLLLQRHPAFIAMLIKRVSNAKDFDLRSWLRCFDKHEGTKGYRRWF